MSNDLPTLPGRLGDPDMTLGTDPRADPRMVAALEPMGLTGPAQPSPVTASTPMNDQHEFWLEAEAGYDIMFGMLAADAIPAVGVTSAVEVIPGIDGNDITLYIHRPDTDVAGALPGVLHIHGGGMAILEASGASYTAWRDHLAATGMVVVGVEFRNATGKLGPHPFPAGLNDCTSALNWMHEHRQDLGISKIVVSGESGGGNLSLATTLSASAEGRTNHIDGVYAQCPYISNAYAEKDPALPSLWENDGYFLACATMGALAKAYDPSGENATNPMAWPYHATVDQLSGLPPHVISVNELDPLRDEGLAYYRKLLAAGVPASSRTVNGTSHAGDCIFAKAIPEVFHGTLRDIKSFADSL